MCFAKKTLHRKDLSPKYDEDNGSVNEQNTNSDLIPIPIDAPEHIDHPFLNKEGNGILALIYETKDQIITVWISEEAFELGNQIEIN